MPKVFKCGRWKPENIGVDLEVVLIGDVGLNAESLAYPFRKLHEETIRLEKIFCSGKHSSYCRRAIG
jgi:hypothetical protein